MSGGASALLAGPDHSSVSRALPLHLLLLPRRLLQRLLGRPAVVRRRRAARQELLGRALAAPGPAERPPLLCLHRRHLPVLPRLRRLAGGVVADSGWRHGV